MRNQYQKLSLYQLHLLFCVQIPYQVTNLTIILTIFSNIPTMLLPTVCHYDILLIIVCILLYISGHHSVNCSQIMRRRSSNLRQWIFLTYALCIPPYTFSSPSTSKMFSSDKTKLKKDIQ